MFGSNPIRKQDLSRGERLWVQEVFQTIQGEGPFAGHAAIFVRLGGCNLRCHWCDTDFESSEWEPSLGELVDYIRQAFAEMNGGIKSREFALVVLTGGEPLRQNVLPLIEELARLGVHTQIETNGTLWIDGLERWVKRRYATLVCSPKTGKVHKKFYDYCLDWKYVCDELSADPQDGLPMASTQVEGKSVRIARPPKADFTLPPPCPVVYIQPLDMDHVDPNMTIRNIRHCVKVVQTYGYRLCLQQHKMIGLP